MAANRKDKTLTPKEAAFVSKYLIDFNATQAAIESGYSKRSARQLAARLLSKDYIQEAIGKEVEKILTNNRSLALRVVRECEKIAFGKISDVMRFDDDGVELKSSDDIDTSTIESVSYDEKFSKGGHSKTKRVKLYSKEKALEILAKYTALYTDAPKIDFNFNTDDEKIQQLLKEHGVNKSEPEN